MVKRLPAIIMCFGILWAAVGLIDIATAFWKATDPSVAYTSAVEFAVVHTVTTDLSAFVGPGLLLFAIGLVLFFQSRALLRRETSELFL